MSHEIRTPMTAIVGFAELLAEGGGSGDQQATWRGQLTRNAAYLQDLIGNILDMSAIESGTLQVERRISSCCPLNGLCGNPPCPGRCQGSGADL